jgi:transposase
MKKPLERTRLGAVLPLSPLAQRPSSLRKNPSPTQEFADSFFFDESAEGKMRGGFVDQGRLFSYISPEARIPANHPLRAIRALVRDVFAELDRSFSRLYANEGRPSIPPEQLLSALLLQVFYGIRSERQLMEQLDYNFLYRWFVGLSPDDLVWDPTVFTKNRDRLQNGEVFGKFMSKLLHHPQVTPLLSDEHFSVDGTLIEAWASQKSFRPKDGSGDGDGGANFHGQQRKNDTHASTTDPDCRLYRKAAGREAKLCYMGHATMENRHGLAVAGMVTLAKGTAERCAAETMLKSKAKEAGHRITVGEDKAYDCTDHVAKLRALNVTPHVAQNDAITATGKHRRSAIDRRTTRHEGYGMSQSRRAMTECIFGWGKQHGTMRKTKHRGIAAVAVDFLLNLIAYNLIRIPKLVAA